MSYHLARQLDTLGVDVIEVGFPTASDGDRAAERWLALRSNPGALYDEQVVIDNSTLSPQITWSTNPGTTTDITGRVPDPSDTPTDTDRDAYRRALDYMGLQAGCHSKDSRWIWCSSDRARTVGSTISRETAKVAA